MNKDMWPHIGRGGRRGRERGGGEGGEGGSELCDFICVVGEGEVAAARVHE